jgi:hypothetical protein
MSGTATQELLTLKTLIEPVNKQGGMNGSFCVLSVENVDVVVAEF